MLNLIQAVRANPKQSAALIGGGGLLGAVLTAIPAAIIIQKLLKESKEQTKHIVAAEGELLKLQATVPFGTFRTNGHMSTEEVMDYYGVDSTSVFPDSVFKEAADHVIVDAQEEGEEEEDPFMEDEPLVTASLVDAQVLPGWDWDEQLAYRESHEIYPLHRDEFSSREGDLPQEEIIYYAGDGVPVGYDNEPLEDQRRVIGMDIPWGVGSDDVDVVYLRNTELGCEYEVVRDNSSYAEEFLGIIVDPGPTELKHSVRRFRDWDD